MTISRKELEDGLDAHAVNPEVVPHALAFIEPLLAHIDHAFPLETSAPLELGKVYDALGDATGDAKVTVKILQGNIVCPQLLFVEEIWQGDRFANVLRDTCYGDLRDTGWNPVPIEAFSPSLAPFVRSVFVNQVASVIERANRKKQEESLVAATLAYETVMAVLECFCNLTCENQGALFRRHVKRMAQLLPRAIPLARIKRKEHGHWTVLV